MDSTLRNLNRRFSCLIYYRYYFRVQNMVPGVTYKFNIINLLKKDSLYNYGR